MPYASKKSMKKPGKSMPHDLSAARSAAAGSPLGGKCQSASAPFKAAKRSK